MNCSLENSCVKGVKTKEGIYDIKSELMVPISESSQNVSYLSQNADSASQSSAQFNFNVSKDSVISRRIYLKQNVTVNIQGSDPSEKLFQSGKEGIRQYPLMNLIESMTLKINGRVITCEPTKFVRPLSLYDSDVVSCYNGLHSMTPIMRDFYNDPNDGVDSNKNPLASYIDFSDIKIEPRGAFPYTVNTNTNTEFEAEFEITVPLMISPLQFDDSNDTQGIPYVQNMSLTINYVSDKFKNFWQRTSSANTISSSSVTLGSNPQVLYRLMTPPCGMRLPDRVCYPWHNITIYDKTQNSIGSGSTATVQSDSLQLQSIPSKLYIWLELQDSDKDETSADTYFTINDLSIRFGNRSALLDSADKKQIYDLCVQNGLKVSYTDFNGKTTKITGSTTSNINLIGSVICLEPDENLGLQMNEAIGMNGKYNITIRATVENLFGSSYAPIMRIAAIDSGYFSIDKYGNTYQSVSSVTEETLARAIELPAVQKVKKSMFGGSLFFTPKGMLRDIKHFGNLTKDVFRGKFGKAAKRIGQHVKDDVMNAPRDFQDSYKLAKQLTGKLGGCDSCGGSNKNGKSILRKLSRKR